MVVPSLQLIVTVWVSRTSGSTNPPLTTTVDPFTVGVTATEDGPVLLLLTTTVKDCEPAPLSRSVTEAVTT